MTKTSLLLSQTIYIDKDVHVKLHVNGVPVPLRKWFVEGNNAKLIIFFKLEKIPAFLTDEAETASYDS